MAEQELHAAHIGAAFEPVRREAMPERVRRDALVDAGGAGGVAEHTVNRFTREPRLGAELGVAGKERGARRPIRFPVLAQGREHARAQHHIARAALAVADVDEHALAVDVVRLEGGDLPDAQPRAVGEHEDGTILRRRGRGEEPQDLAPAQELGEHARDFRARDRCGAVPVPRGQEQAANRPELDVARARALDLGDQGVHVPFDVPARDRGERSIDVREKLARVPHGGEHAVGGERTQRRPLAPPV
jgi:hypothetical protein